MVKSLLLRRTGLRVYLGALLAADHLFRWHSQMVPRLCYWDHQNARELKVAGERFLQFFINVCGLKPDAHILDVGCGIGRIAVPLTHYLSTSGSYEGFDIIPEAIRWCSRKITPKYPNFHFQVANVANKNYNPHGTVQAAEYTFPYEDATFDFVFLSSVFTHMLPQELERYLSEIARVLKAGGTSLITYFLLTPDSLGRIERGESTLSFKYSGIGFQAVSEIVPEKAVAYDESYIRRLYKQNALTVTKPIRYGTWSYEASNFEYQDFVIATRQ